MPENEKELLKLIREHDDPKQAFDIAIGLMFDFLDEREEPQDTSSVHPRESA